MRIYIIAALALAIMAAGAGIYRAGQSNEREKAKDNYIDTRKGMDNADIGTGDKDDDLDWLRDAAGRRCCDAWRSCPRCIGYPCGCRKV